ncbi:hypothetical protein EB001_23585, partial [bacterium]|nr:hypothetical protein [bacterium]
MKQHKWHKEIKAWADGAEIEFRVKNANDDWKTLNFECPNWYYEPFEYRIKPQPKEPKYLYVWLDKDEDRIEFDHYPVGDVKEDAVYKYIGKIKLE